MNGIGRYVCIYVVIGYKGVDGKYKGVDGKLIKGYIKNRIYL